MEVGALSLTLRAIGADAVGRAMAAVRRELKATADAAKATDGQIDGLKSQIQTLAATLGTVAGAGATMRAVDAFQTLNNQIRLATTGAEQFAAAQADVVRIAQQTFQPVESVAELYAKAARSAAALGLSQSDVAKLTDTVAKSLLINGTEAGAAAGALQQFGQALANGKVMAEEFNSILDGMAPLIQGIEKDMGLIPGSLKRLVTEGKVSSQQFAQMILNNKSVSETFANYIPTISQNLVALRNQFVLVAGAVGQTSGLTEKISQAIRSLTQNLPQVVGLVGAAAAAWLSYVTAIRLAITFSAIITGVQTISAFFSLAKAVRSVADAAALLSLAGGGIVKLLAVIAGAAAAFVGYNFIVDQINSSTEGLNAQIERQRYETELAARTEAWRIKMGQKTGQVILDTTKKTATYIQQLVELAGLVPITTGQQAQLVAEQTRLRDVLNGGNISMTRRLEIAKQLSSVEKALADATVRRTVAEAEAAMTRSPAVGRTPTGGPGKIDPSRIRTAAAEVGALIDAEFRDKVLATAEQLGEQLKQTLANGVASAFETLLTRGATIGDAFGALTASLLRGLGDMTIAFGISVMKIGKLMTSAVAALKGLQGPGAIAAGLALVALGGMMRGAAGRAFGGVGGGSAPVIAGGGLGGAGGPMTLPGLTFGPTAAAAGPDLNPRSNMTFNIIGTNDPSAQRQLQEMLRNADRRGGTTTV